MKTKLLLSAILSFYFYLLSSQVPQGFNYQAAARDNDGLAIKNKLLTVKISIQPALTSGNEIWIETHSVTTDDLGVISLVIGEGTPAGGTAANFSDINWGGQTLFLRTQIDLGDGGGYLDMGTSQLWSVPYSMVAKDLKGTVTKLGVTGTTSDLTEALFEVKNFNNQTVFAVYGDGVRAYVDNISKGAKGGFAIGGFGKGQDYLVVDPGNIKMYIDDVGKGAKGGFAIGGYGKGGNFFNVDAADVGTVSENRVLWHPLKNAFLAGNVLITNPANVGENSFATGYQSMAKGQYSQAMGYMSKAMGDNSSAIGNNALANANNSFAFGDGSSANYENSYAFGKSSVSNGISSYAFGESVTAGSPAAGNCYAFGLQSQATGDGSYAFGNTALATGTNSTAFGKGAQAINTSSFAFGESALSESTNSFALGLGAHAFGQSCYAFGEGAQASNQNSCAIGKGAIASGYSSFAFGTWGQDAYTHPAGSNTIASGNYSFAAGQGSVAHGNNSIAIGFCTDADGDENVAIGYGSKAYGNRSPIAIGEFCASTGVASVSMGYWSVAAGDQSFAVGHSPVASNFASVALGSYTTANSDYTTVIGKGNLGLTNSLFEIGNGTWDWGPEGTHTGYQSNALTLLKNGNLGLGTSDPAAKFEVAVSGYNANAGIGINRISEGGKLITINQGYLGKLNFTAPGSDLVTFDFNSLNVGIGITNPASPLHVVKSVANGHLVNFNNTNSTGKGIVIILGSTTAQFITFLSPTYGEMGYIYGDGTGAVLYSAPSDVRLKENISNTLYSISDLMKIKVRDFNYKSDNSKTKITGYVAQELYEVYPNAVSKPADEKNYWGVDYAKVTPLIVKAVQDQQQMIGVLKDENQQLKSQNEDLLKRLEKIEAILAKAGNNK